MRVLRPVCLDPQCRYTGARVGFDGHEMLVAREQSLEILAPEQYSGKPGDEIAFRAAEYLAQVVVVLELANRVARRDEVLDGAGVVRRAAQPGRLKQRTDPARLHLFRAADNKFSLRQIQVGGDREIIDAGNQTRQADNPPEPRVEQPEEAAKARGAARRRDPGIDDGGGTADRLDSIQLSDFCHVKHQSEREASWSANFVQLKAPA